LVLCLALTLFCIPSFPMSGSGIIDNPSSLITLPHRRTVKLPPPAKGTVKGRSRTLKRVLQPLWRTPHCAANILPACVQDVPALLRDLSEFVVGKADSILNVR